MKKRSILLPALIAAMLSGTAYAQGAGSAGGAPGGAGGSTGPGSSSATNAAGDQPGPGPAGRSLPQDSADTGSSRLPAARSDRDLYNGSTMSSGSMSSSGTSAAPGTADVAPPSGDAAPLSRSAVQSEATNAAHSDEIPRGEALITRSRPHGGPLGDAPNPRSRSGY